MLKTPHNNTVFFYAFVYLNSKAYGYIIIRIKGSCVEPYFVAHARNVGARPAATLSKYTPF